MKQNSVTRKISDWLNRTSSLNFEILSYFFIFSCVLIVLLWLFQIVFLDDIYKSIKVNDVKNTSRELIADVNSESLDDMVDTLSLENDMSAIVVDFTNNTQLQGNIIGNSILGSMTRDDLNKLHALTLEKGTTMLYVSNIHSFDDVFNQNYDNMHDSNVRSVIRASTITTSAGHDVMIIIASTIMPVNATTNTLKRQLLIISIILLVCSLIISLIASRRIAKPIEQINKDAKIMATGDYSVKFNGRGYMEIEELNDTLNYTVGQLQKADQMSRDLIANVSHDLRTPLTMISGYGEVMRDVPGENTPENVQVIIDESKRLTMLVNNLLDISKLQSGTIGISLSVVNVCEMVAKIADSYRKMTEKGGYQIILMLPSEDVYVKADPLRLQQVFYNLLNNAITYTGPDKKVVLKAAVISGKVRFDVIDSGRGIAAQDIPLVWQRYYKVDKEHIRPETGSGLGLSIVKTILELHHASYGVDSELGHGSDFWFALPVEPSTVEQD